MCADHSEDYERRKQRRLRALGSNDPHCCCCGHSDWQDLEAHHIEGRANGETLSIVCRHCHRKLSDAQLDHPKAESVEDAELNSFAHFLLGFADILELAVAKLREIARGLIARVSGEPSQTKGA